MENINLTEKQIELAGVHFFDTLFTIEGKGGMKLTAMTECVNSKLHNPDGTPFVFVTFEVARWAEDEDGDLVPQHPNVWFFPEDFDGAVEEFEFQNLIRRGLSS